MPRPTDRRLRLRWTVLVLAIAVAGCTRPPEFAPVQGTVTRGGRPVAKVEVAFYADGDTRGPRATGLTDDSGRYHLRAETGEDGAVVGQYRVCLFDRSLPLRFPGIGPRHPVGDAAKDSPHDASRQLSSKDAKKGPVSRVSVSYGRPSETPLRATVQPGGSSIDLQLP